MSSMSKPSVTAPFTAIAQRAAVLEQLRAVMRRHQVDAILIPSSDPHLSEYLPQRWKGREYLSGFTGSVGAFIATLDFAGVWTDPRYWDQAEAELAGSAVTLMKISSGASVLHIDWLAAHLQPGQTVAVTRMGQYFDWIAISVDGPGREVPHGGWP